MTKPGRRLPRFRQDAAAKFMILTPRDGEIILKVARFHFLRSTQILRLISGPRVPLLRRLQLLYHHGWLNRPRCQLDYYHQAGGSSPMVYGLGSRGVALMRGRHDMPFKAIVRGRGGKDVGRVHLEHTLLTAESLIGIEALCTQTNGQVRFINRDDLPGMGEHFKIPHWSVPVKGERIVLVPDAVFGLEFTHLPPESRLVVCCLEADRGTMPIIRKRSKLSCLSRKYAAYSAFWASGETAAFFGGAKRFCVITVTPSAARAASIKEMMSLMGQGRGLFQIFTEAEISNGTAGLLTQLQPSRRDLPANI